MNKLSRRSVLKTGARLTTLGALSSLFPLLTSCGGGSSAGSERSIILNVVCHGLFAMNVTDLGLELFTPELGDELNEKHMYKAGSWDKDLVRDLEKQRAYRLRGVQYRSECPQPSNSACDLRFSQSKKKFTIHPQFSRHVVYLPFPEKISLLRCINNGPNTEDGNVIYIKSLSLCQVFSYFAPDYREVNLLEISPNNRTKSFDWEPRVEPATGTANLHLWAEPSVRLLPYHAGMAYRKLSLMTHPLAFRLKTYDTAPLDRDTGVLGVSPEEEQGWSEWANGGEGSYPTNCSLVRSVP